jgi:hypothetical protein
MLASMTQEEAPPSYPHTLDLEGILRRSVELDLTAMALLRPESYAIDQLALDTMFSYSACEVALEHARAIRTLISEGFDTSAASLLRLQFEAQVRSIWLVWAASEKELEAIDAEPTAQTEAAANKILPGVATMVKALKDTGPPGCFEMLDGFRTMIVPTLNAFVHSGFHPLKQHTRGYPETLTIRVLKDSNAIFCMTTMQLAALTGDAEIIVPMSKIQPGFADCLPPLILRQKA